MASMYNHRTAAAAEENAAFLTSANKPFQVSKEEVVAEQIRSERASKRRKVCICLVLFAVMVALFLGLGLGLGLGLKRSSNESGSGGKDDPNNKMTANTASGSLSTTISRTATTTATVTNSVTSLSSTGSGTTNRPTSTTSQSATATVTSSNSISSLISEQTFTKAVEQCGITAVAPSTIYQTLNNGFSKTPIPGGLSELALLMGQIAFVSLGFTFTHSQPCVGSTYPTPQCPDGFYYSRGYIQLTGEKNYRAAANALGREDLFVDPDLVARDPSVNWAVVQWYWTSTVQPLLASNGYTLAASTQAMNGPKECGPGKTIASDRIKYVQCFQQQFVGASDSVTTC
ncbi:lysozyme-like domain-containing protein [Obelidium mucronatum]|nr:lysozyme-like domain-containing protein [Obelidium mucronatum]